MNGASFIGTFHWRAALPFIIPILLTLAGRLIFPHRAHIKAAILRARNGVVQAAARSCGPRFIKLFGHFFFRFFDADVAAEEGEPRLALPHILAVCFAPCAITSIYLFWKYADLLILPGPVAQSLMRSDRCFYVLVSMVVTGFLAIIEWDALFLDRRDYLVLGSLPVPARIIFGAKAASVLAFLALFAIDINIAGEIAYPVMLMGNDTSYLPFFRNQAAHAICMVVASAFVFLFCMALQGVLMNLLPYRSFKRTGPYLQGMLVFAFVSSFLLYPEAASRLPYITTRDDALYFLFPPFWFYGLYDWLLGHSEPIFRELAKVAAVAFATTALVAAATYLLSYRRLLKASMQVQEGTEETSHSFGGLFEWIAARSILRDARERATFAFVARTMNRSRIHRLALATFVAVGMSMVVNHLVGAFGAAGYGTVQPGSVSLLIIPLLLTFFILTGMRTIFAYPSQLRANWLFRAAEGESWAPYVNGTRKAMLFLGVLPLLLGMLPFYKMLWGWRVAALHLIFVLAAAMILIEAQLFGFRKIPFTCGYVPGKTNLIALLAIYAFVLLAYVYSMAWMENGLLQAPRQMTVFFAIGAGVIALLRWRSARLRSEQARVVFEESADPAVRQLGLSFRL